MLWVLMGITHSSQLHSFLCPHFWARYLMLVTVNTEYWKQRNKTDLRWSLECVLLQRTIQRPAMMTLEKSRFFSWSPRGPKIAIVRSSNVYYDHGQLPASWRHHREYYPSCIGALNIHWRPWPHLESTLQRNWYQESYAPRQCPTLNRTSAVLIGLDAWIDCKLYWRLRLVSHAGDAALKGVKTYANLCGRAFHWASKIGPTFGIILSWNWS